ncbi:ABC transporter ATP-binding protein, partial [Micromonospora sp. M51]|nr:ABC transporter ATP-binding protein [Micromonospora sp. M51]
TLLVEHRRLVGPRTPTDLDRSGAVVEAVHSDRHTSLLVRDGGLPPAPGWQAQPVALEELVLAYLRRPSEPSTTVPSGVPA